MISEEYGQNRQIYMVVGASGSGKSWVCNQLQGVHYIQYDKLPPAVGKSRAVRVGMALETATHQQLPIVIDPTVGVSTILKRYPVLEYKLYCIVETPAVVQRRLEQRGGKMTPGVEARIKRIAAIARLYGTFSGTSAEVLEKLQQTIGS